MEQPQEDLSDPSEYTGSSYLINGVLLVFMVFGYYVMFLSKSQISLFGRPCSTPRWNVGLKQLWALITIVRYRLLGKRGYNLVRSYLPTDYHLELEQRRKNITNFNSDVLRVMAFDQQGNSVAFGFFYYESWCEVSIQVTLAGESYVLPSNPLTMAGVFDARSKDWESGGLKFEILEPLSRFRVTFGGLLKKLGDHGEDPSLHYMRLNLTWSGHGGLVDVRDDWHPLLMSEALAREPWHQNEWLHLIKDQGSGFDQWGALHGEISIDSAPAVEVNLPSLRQRRWGPAESNTLVRRFSIAGFTKDGALFYIRATCSPLGLTYAKFGHIKLPNGKLSSISWCNIGLENLSDSTKAALPRNLTVTFKVDGRQYNVFTSLPDTELRVKGDNFLVRIVSVQLTLNGDCGYGAAEFWYREDASTRPVTTPPIYKTLQGADESAQRLVLGFSEPGASHPDLTGGKGSSLALLSQLTKDEFEVPDGFIITTNALDVQLKTHRELLTAVHLLRNCAEIDLSLLCEKVSDLIKSTPMCEEVAYKVTERMKTISDVQVAVRSSAVGEDSDQSSAAGQNSTFLGVRGISEVLKAVQECWASLYSFQSVQYRRQHGQHIVCKMAVVVQEMVAADKAGVVFTRDPITGDPRQILITANYGLGETVVSGDVDPDTIVVQRKTDSSLTIASVQVGEKKHQMRLTADGTEKTNMADALSSKPCLSEEEMLTLARMAVLIEETYDRPLDIEWAVASGRLYLLQARPITSLSQWTDAELQHEMDTAVLSETNITTLANTGEVLPGATTVLTQSIVLVCLNKNDMADVTDIVQVTNHHTTIDVLGTMLRMPEKNITVANKISDVAVMGHVVTNAELHQIAVRRNGVASRLKLTRILLDSLWSCYRVKRIVAEARTVSSNFQLNAERFESALELHRAINIQVSLLQKVTDLHQFTSTVNVFYQVVLMSTLAAGKTDLSNDNLTDMAAILSSCSDVISGEIPLGLQKISEMAVTSGKAEEFIEQPAEDGLYWLRTNAPAVARELEAFLKLHGHRGIREFELATEVWGLKPATLIDTIQSSVRHRLNAPNVSKPKQISTADDIFRGLKSRVKPSMEKLLKMLIRLIQESVAHREATKACLIRVIHEFRLGFRKLGALMVTEGMLPRHDLVFHLTNYEIGRVMKTKDPSLVIKAMRRQRLYPKWDKLKFSEVLLGVPKPLEEDSLARLCQKGDIRLQGTPVFPGTLLGRALVILDLKDISLLRQGDILITYSTDVGWSPYFPLLGGVVTELGGLISHGAVVAREYGLPCLVGVENATCVFKTGDTVLLSGSNGTIEKITESDAIE